MAVDQAKIRKAVRDILEAIGEELLIELLECTKKYSVDYTKIQENI